MQMKATLNLSRHPFQSHLLAVLAVPLVALCLVASQAGAVVGIEVKNTTLANANGTNESVNIVISVVKYSRRSTPQKRRFCDKSETPAQRSDPAKMVLHPALFGLHHAVRKGSKTSSARREPDIHHAWQAARKDHTEHRFKTKRYSQTRCPPRKSKW